MSSQAIVVPEAFQQRQLAAVFQGQQASDDLSHGVSGGYGLIGYKGKVWSIRHQGQNLTLMNDAGDGARPVIEVVILKANPNLSKTWYENGYQEGSDAPPDCASANGVFPDAGVPKKQAPVCAQCPRNQWGTAVGGTGKGKACGDHRRMAVVPASDLRNEHFGGPMLLRCPAASLQDLANFEARFKAMGYPYYSMVIKIGFDVAESFPKFVFTGVRPLTNEEAAVVVEMRDDGRVNRVISEGDIPAGPAPAALPNPAAAFEQGIPQGSVAPKTAAPVVQPAPVVAPAPQAAPVTVQQPVAQAPVMAAAPAPGGFGPAVAQQQPAQAAAPQPQRTMTGFGPAPATPPGNAPQPVQTAVPQPQQPVVQQASPAFDQSIDDRLAALMAAGNAGAAQG